MRSRLILTLLLFMLPFVCLAQSFVVSDAPYQDRRLRSSVEGARIFQNHCASCHGVDGRGRGPAASALKRTLPDLTMISHRNGAKFPYQQVRDIIEGKEPGSAARGNREMPIWGPIFHEIDADQDWGEVRLDAITRQIESLQRK